jgi:hypothetical protein
LPGALSGLLFEEVGTWLFVHADGLGLHFRWNAVVIDTLITVNKNKSNTVLTRINMKLTAILHVIKYSSVKQDHLYLNKYV